jgi:hypothetical protein
MSSQKTTIKKYRVYVTGGSYIDIPLIDNLSISLVESETLSTSLIEGKTLSIGDMRLAITPALLMGQK